MESKTTSKKKNKKRKKRKQPAGVRLFSLTALILIGFIIFRFEGIVSGAWNLSAGANAKNSIESNYEMGYKDTDTFHIGEGYILKFGDGVMRYYDKTGQPKWEKNINGQDILVESSKETFVVVAPSSGDIFLIDMNGKILAKKFGTGQVDRVIHASKDSIICVYNQEKILRVYNQQLESTADIHLPDGDILDVDVSKTDNLLAMSMFRLENDTYHSQILTYQLDGQAIGAINMKDEIILDINVIGSLMIGVTDDMAFAYNTENELVWSVDIDRTIKRASISDDGGVLLNLVRSEEDLKDTRAVNALVYIDKSGEMKDEIPIEYDVETLSFRGNSTVFSTSDRLYVLSEKGKLESIIETGDNLRKFGWLSDTLLGVEFGDRLDILKVN